MPGGLAYLDTSAFVKLIVTEPESRALKRELIRWPERASATVLRTETVRALRRTGNDRYVAKARKALRSVHLVHVDEALLDRAGDLPPPELRSLDAIHLAAALTLVPDIGIMFVYGNRLERAARATGVETASPA